MAPKPGPSKRFASRWISCETALVAGSVCLTAQFATDKLEVTESYLRFARGVAEQFFLGIEGNQQVVRLEIQVFKAALSQFACLRLHQFLDHIFGDQVVGAGILRVHRGVMMGILCRQQFVRSIPEAPDGDVIATLLEDAFAVR